MNFTADDEQFGQIVTTELKPGGGEILVTDENKEEYVKLLVDWKIYGRVKDQMDAFLEGFLEFVPKELVSVFDERELELLIGGMSEIDVADWKANTEYRGYTKDDTVIKQFWETIEQWENEKRLKLLQFVTGTSRIPVNGFKDLHGSDGPRKFTIEKTGDVNSLPKSHTCFNRLDLPPYKSRDALAQKLMYSIEETMGFAQE